MYDTHFIENTEYVFVDTVVITNSVTTLTAVSSVALMPQSGTLNHIFF